MDKIAWLFPGQGSQYLGMGKKLFERFAVVRPIFEQASDILGFDLKNLCFNGSLEELTQTANTQPALLTVSFAAYKVYMQDIGVEPLYCAGHSLGEISALTCSGVLDFEDALLLARKRGEWMQEVAASNPGAMAAIYGVDQDEIAEECRNISAEDNLVVVSNINAPNQVVISGHVKAVRQLAERFEKSGVKVVAINVNVPFHSPLMAAAAAGFGEELKKYTYHEFTYPVIANVTAQPYSGRDSIVENLSRQIVQPVRWHESMTYLVSRGITVAIELGPKHVLRNLMRSIAPAVASFSFDVDDDEEEIRNRFSPKGTPPQAVDRPGLRLVTRCVAISVCTRNRNWDEDEYQAGFVKPYREILKMLDELEKADKEPTLEQMKDALEMLRSGFVTKRTPLPEQIERFNQVFDESGTRQLFPDFRMPGE